MEPKIDFNFVVVVHNTTIVALLIAETLDRMKKNEKFSSLDYCSEQQQQQQQKDEKQKNILRCRVFIMI